MKIQLEQLAYPKMMSLLSSTRPDHWATDLTLQHEFEEQQASGGEPGPQEAFHRLVNEYAANAQVALVSAEQLALFGNTDIPAGTLRLPFSALWLEFEDPTHVWADKQVWGCLIFETKALASSGWPRTVLLYVGETVLMPLIVRAAMAEVSLERVWAELQSYHQRDWQSSGADQTAEQALLTLLRATFNVLHRLTFPHLRLERPQDSLPVQGPVLVTEAVLVDSDSVRTTSGVLRVLFVDEDRITSVGAPASEPLGRIVDPHLVRGHWRTLVRGRDQPRTVWINAHTRGTGEHPRAKTILALRGGRDPLESDQEDTAT